MSKASAITIGIVIAVFVGFLVVLGLQKNNIDYSVYDTNSIIPGDANNGNIADHVRGPKDAKIFLVEYADFSCPMCAEANPLIEQYLEEKSGQVALIFRDSPVQSSHPNSVAAASAVEAAGFIKKSASALTDPDTATKISAGYLDDTYYFEMMDILFKNRTVWWTVDSSVRNDTFVDLFRRAAPEASVDEFLSLMGSEQIKAKVNFDLGLGKHQGVTGTPTYYLDGEKLPISTLADIDGVLKPAIEAALKSSESK